MRKAIRVFDIFFAAVCAVLFVMIGIGAYALPDSVITYDGSETPFSSIYSYADTKNTSARLVDAQTASPRQRTIKIFGVVPVKTVTVTDKDSQNVLVSGDSFGIKLYTDGVIVVGTQSVESLGKKKNPAADAGIEVGDIVVSINNEKVYSSDRVSEILNDNNGAAFSVKVKRDGRYKTFSVTPVFDSKEDCYKAGMWVRDSTAGIGTITFFNPAARTFGALGHQVNDVDTNEIMPLFRGEAVSAKVTKIQKGNSGTTGSLVCDFGTSVIGRLKENTDCGVFGTYTAQPSCFGSYPVAAQQEVKRGKAQILSTVDGKGPRLYDVEISHITYNENTRQRNMMIKVTDKDLIAKTGGIVQGMSGSPIIQDGKLVGAVTHVVISNPKRGYGVFAQTMLEESQRV